MELNLPATLLRQFLTTTVRTAAALNAGYVAFRAVSHERRKNRTNEEYVKGFEAGKALGREIERQDQEEMRRWGQTTPRRLAAGREAAPWHMFDSAPESTPSS